MARRRVIPSALINEGQVVIEGEDHEPLPDDKEHVIVSPSTGRAYSRGRGNRVGDLPPDVWEIPKSTWYWWIRRKKGNGVEEKPSLPPPSSSSPSIDSDIMQMSRPRCGRIADQPNAVAVNDVLQSDALLETLRSDCASMQRYFPSFGLFYEDETVHHDSGHRNDISFDCMVWCGSIDGLGEVSVQYKNEVTYSVSVGHLTETENRKINEFLCSKMERLKERQTPVDVLISVLKYIATHPQTFPTKDIKTGSSESFQRGCLSCGSNIHKEDRD